MAENLAVPGSSTEPQDNGEKGDLKSVWLPRAEFEALRQQGAIVFSEESCESVPVVQRALTELQRLQKAMSNDAKRADNLLIKLKNREEEDLVKLKNMSKDQGNSIQKIEDMLSECVNPHMSIPTTIALPQTPVPLNQLTSMANSSIQYAVSTSSPLTPPSSFSSTSSLLTK